MVDIPISKERSEDIYDYNFNKNLYRPLTERGVTSDVIYDILNGAVSPTVLSSGALLSEIVLGAGGNIRQGQTKYNIGTGFWLGDDGGTARFSIGDASTNSITWDGQTMTIRGVLNAGDISAGTIDASYLNVDYLSALSSDMGTLTAGNITLSSDGYIREGQTSYDSGTGFWLGDVNGTPQFSIGDASANKLTWDGTTLTLRGVLNADDITAGTLNPDRIEEGALASTKFKTAVKGWSHDLTFSSTDSDTIAWTAGSIILSDGTYYSIDAGNTGDMGDLTYVYLDIDTSTSSLQTTTTLTDSVGDGKIVIASANSSTSEAIFQSFGGSGGIKVNKDNIQAGAITADEIAANTITANELAANSVTATEMDVAYLSAIAADMGTLTAGNLTLSSGGYVREGQTDYNTGSGFWLGDVSGSAKFSIGNSTGDNNLTWDGDNLTINKTKLLFQSLFGNGEDGNVTISSNTTLTADRYYDDLTINSGYTLSPAGYRIFVKGTLTNNGYIDRSGNDGEGGADSNDGGAALGGGYLAGSGAGGRGGVGSGENGIAGGSVTSSLGGSGGTGANNTYTGGAGGSASQPPTTSGRFSVYPSAVSMYDYIEGNRIYGGGGGGGGAGNGNETGGGGGSGAGVMVICAKEFVNNGTIRANGGNGGAGENNVAGGGGGGAGSIVIVYNTLTDNGTFTALGGSGGVAGGASGSNGTITFLQV